MIRYKLFDTETKREREGEAEFAIIIADGKPVIAGAAPASKLLAALLGLAEAMVERTGEARIPVSARWQAVHICIGHLRAAVSGTQVTNHAPITASDVMAIVGRKLGPAAERDVQEAVAERLRGGSRSE